MENEPFTLDEHMIAEIDKAHRADVARARTLISQAVATADAEWLPRNATVEAMLSLIDELANHGAYRVDRPQTLS